MCHRKHSLGSLLHLLFTVKITSVVGRSAFIKYTSKECYHLKRVKGIINKPCNEDQFFPRFQTFAMFWMLYAFFCVIPQRLNFICGTFVHCSFSPAGRCEDWIKSAKKRRYVVQDKPSQNSNWGGDLREAPVDIPLTVCHSCFLSHSSAL